MKKAALLVLLLTACSTAEIGRGPASETEGPALGLDPVIYSDFFSVDSGGKRLKYRMDFRFHTDLDKEYMRTRAFAAFQMALAKTLSTNEATLAARLKKNLMESMIEEFVKTLYVVKILNGTIQADIHFFPMDDNPQDFSPELDNNNLLNGAEKGGLAQKLEEMSTKTDTQRIAAAMQNEVIQARRGPHKYLGGSISLWVKIADLRWDPLSKLLPDTKKNAVKGFLRYRRWFLADAFKRSGSECAEKGVTLKELRFGPAKGEAGTKQFVTVDIYKNFNLASLSPKIDSAEVYFGLLLPTNKGRSRLLPDSDPRTGDPFKTGELRVTSRHEQFSGKEFVHRVGGLTYSYEKKGFDSGRSAVKSEAVNWDPDADPQDSYWAGKELLPSCTEAFVKDLGLARFFRSEP